MDKQSKSNKHHSRDGKRLRWARNVVRKWMDEPYESPVAASFEASRPIMDEIMLNRYERAAALIIAHKLSQ